MVSSVDPDIAAYEEKIEDKSSVGKIAVIGSGLAGLTTAYLLSTQTTRRFDVHLFEREERIGVDAASVSVNVINEEGKCVDVSIDVPMRSIDSGYYPRLLRLLEEVDVAVRPNDLTFAFSSDTSLSKIPYLIYNGLSGIQGLSVPATESYIKAFFEILYHSICFIYLCILSLLHYHLHVFPQIKQCTFEEFRRRYRIPKVFFRDVLVPLYSGVCTCRESDVLKYPAGLIVDYIASVFGTRHYTIASPQGFKAVVSALISPIPFSNIHTSTSISRISGLSGKYTLHSGTTTFGPFTHVIMATPAPVSSSILFTLSTIPKSLHLALRKFKYIPTLVITHTDPGFIPSSPSLHRDIHFQRPSTPVTSLHKLTDYTQATHLLHYRSPHLKSRTEVYQTTNPHRFPEKGTVLGQTWFERYLPSLESLRVRREVFGAKGWGQGMEGVWFAASWCAEGVPLLEGCVVSAEAVVEKVLASEVSYNGGI